MKIVLLTGMSGVGKTAIAKNLYERYGDKYNFVFSYTDRPMRDKNEWGHTFIEGQYMDLIMERSDIVAKSKIEQYRYCALESQFDKNKVNLYIVDVDGINDTISYFPQADIMTVLIRREKIEVDCIREGRDVSVPIRDDVDFLIDNNYKLDTSADILNVLVNFDFFKKPSHIVKSISDKLEDVDSQYRLLDNVRVSLLEQLWYAEQQSYINLCKYVEKEINNIFDFDISIIPDYEPCIYDGMLVFNIQASHNHEEIMWAEMHRLTECLGYYAHLYCKEHDLYDLEYRLFISEELMENE